MGVMISVPVANSAITHVYIDDIGGNPGVIRTLITHPDLYPDLRDRVRLLPVKEAEERIHGYTQLVEDINEKKWRRLETPVPWESGSVPVSVTESGGVVFCTHRDLYDMKLRWMSARVPLAFDDQNRSLLQRVAILEHADSLMGGHPLTVAALLLLSERNPGAIEFGDPIYLQYRWKCVAKSGVSSLHEEISRPEIQIPEQLETDVIAAALRCQDTL